MACFNRDCHVRLNFAIEVGYIVVVTGLNWLAISSVVKTIEDECSTWKKDKNEELTSGEWLLEASKHLLCKWSPDISGVTITSAVAQLSGMLLVGSQFSIKSPGAVELGEGGFSKLLDSCLPVAIVGSSSEPTADVV